MIISRTPFRISLFGGGTDMPKWYLKNNGQVLSSTIDKYAYLIFKPLPNIFKENIRLVYSKTELVNNVSQIKHPSIRETLKYMKILNNIDIHYDGDLPGFSGLGSSSAFTVGLLNILSKYKGVDISKRNLGLKSIHIEQNLIKENVGSQDQMAVSMGGLNHILFKKNGNIIVKKMNLDKKVLNKLQENLLLFFTGIRRNSNIIQKNYLKNIMFKSKQLDSLYRSVDIAIDLLNNGKVDDIGNLMNEMWVNKKKLNSKVSSKFIDEIYTEAKNSGALGGKITGAGGGGFILFYAKKNTINLLKKNYINLKMLLLNLKMKEAKSYILISSSKYEKN